MNPGSKPLTSLARIHEHHWGVFRYTVGVDGHRVIVTSCSIDGCSASVVDLDLDAAA